MIPFKPGIKLEVDGETVTVTSVKRLKTRTPGKKFSRRYAVGVRYESNKRETLTLSIDTRKYQIHQGRADHIGQGMGDLPATTPTT
jgi:hypothetical protein